MKRTNVFLPEPIRKKLQSLAKKDDTTMAELIRQAISEFLSKVR